MTKACLEIPNYGTLIESWSAYALQRSGNVTPFIVPGIDSSGHTNFAPARALRFWLRPYWSSAPEGKGPGKNARLVELVAVDGKQTARVFSLQVNEDGTVLSLIAESDKGPVTLIKSEICWQAGQWHQIVLNHGAKATTLHVDGELVGESEPVLQLPARAVALVWGSAWDGTDSLEGEIEELYTFSKPLEVAFHYFTLKDQAALGPITAEEDQAMAELRAKWKAEREAAGEDGGTPMLRLVGSTPECITNVPVYITNIVAVFDTNSGWTVTFDVQGSWDGSDMALYDIFMTTNLVGDSIANSQWVWLERGPSCSTYQYTNQPTETACYVLGTPLDSDGDSLPDAYERLVSHSDPYASDLPVILFQPLSQTIDWGDNVAFSVIAQGAAPLRYQWLLNTNPISGETNSSLILSAVQPSQAGDYSVEVTSAVGLSVLSSNATLTVLNPDNWPVVTLTGQRQDYTFRNGVTYYLGSRVELYGITTIEGGAIIKPDWYYPDSSLAVMGTLVCKTDDAYLPAFLTSVEDDTLGDALWFSSGYPFTAENGVPYLDLAQAQGVGSTLNNLRIRYADQGVRAAATNTLDVWNCQFVECASGIVAGQNAVVRLHNVLFGACGSVVAGATNFNAISGEHVTAVVTNFWTESPPGLIALTNSIVVGSVGSGPTLVTEHTAINPASPVFQPAGAGHHYLTNNSPYRQAGTTNVSPRLLAEFQQKTTQPPLAFPGMMQISGELVLGPQAARYTNGAPDYGYYYPALDYTVAWITNRGTITVLPGTAVGFRNEYSAAHGRWTWWGFDLREGSIFISHGSPTKPNVFTDVQFVQEQLGRPCFASFVPDYWPFSGPNWNTAPTMDFRFSKFYAHPNWYHVWGGYDEGFFYYAVSPDSLVNWTMRDCELHGGRVNLGNPDDGWYFGAPWDYYYGVGAVSWFNNLFENVSINLDPTYYWYDQETMNCDMQIEARNNLFRGGLWFHLEPIPATAGDWVFKDNLFDKVNFVQNTNTPIDFDYNGYWPLMTAELDWLWYYYPWWAPNSSQLQVTTNGNGGHEAVLTAAPPYQAGPLGNFYLPATTPLYHAGSRAVGEAGLHQYTTQTNQMRAGDELPSAHEVSIGLHYVATANANSTLPKDSDADGVPDYVEDANGNGTWDEGVETQIDTAYTMSGIHDSTNLVYDDVDLSGNGLVGRIKKALGLSPFDTSNPLTLTQIATGDEPDIATFSLPVSCNVITNIGRLSLWVDGNAVSFQECDRNTNGNCLLLWNTTYSPPGQCYLQARLLLNGQLQKGDTPDRTILSGSGPVISFFSSNVCQFNPFYAEYDEENGAILHARLPEPNAEYTIELRTAAGDPIRTITGSTTTGEIDESWDLTDGEENPYTGESVNAVFTVTLTVSAISGSNTAKLQKDRAYIFDGDFTVAYAWKNTSLAQGAMRDCIQWGAVDTLMKPTWAGGYNQDPYYSTFNDFSWSGGPGKPGYIATQTNVPALLTNLALFATRNFLWDGHGGYNSLGNARGDNDPLLVNIAPKDVQDVLQNYFYSKRGPIRQHPYRFVFLNTCRTADHEFWREAFGVLDRITSAELARKPSKAQAFVGWVGDVRGPDSAGEFYDFALTYAVFYGAWMNGATLDQCISMASKKYPFAPNNYSVELNFPLGRKYEWYWNPLGISPGLNRFRIRVFGYAGITRSGYEPNYDNSPYYK